MKLTEMRFNNMEYRKIYTTGMTVEIMLKRLMGLIEDRRQIILDTQSGVGMLSRREIHDNYIENENKRYRDDDDEDEEAFTVAFCTNCNRYHSQPKRARFE